MIFDQPYTYQDTEDFNYRMAWHPTPQEIITKQVFDAISRDREGKVRQALIDLGWTPPDESSKEE